MSALTACGRALSQADGDWLAGFRWGLDRCPVVVIEMPPHVCVQTGVGRLWPGLRRSDVHVCVSGEEQRDTQT